MKKMMVFLLVSANAFSATTGTLELSGSVDQVLSLTVTPQSGVNDDLDLESSQSDLGVASVNEVSNASNGYKITLSSQNNGVLKNGSADQLSYTLKYDGSNVRLTSSGVTAKTVSSTGVYNNDSDVEISYTGKPAEEMVAGTYSDTLTFTIVAN